MVDLTINPFDKPMEEARAEAYEYFDRHIRRLPESHPVRTKQRENLKRPGAPIVLEIRYTHKVAGAKVDVYLKGYFAHDQDMLEIEFEVQSLRDNNEDQNKVLSMQGRKKPT